MTVSGKVPLSKLSKFQWKDISSGEKVAARACDSRRFCHGRNDQPETGAIQNRLRPADYLSTLMAAAPKASWENICDQARNSRMAPGPMFFSGTTRVSPG